MQRYNENGKDLVLAIYDGDPMWKEVRYEIDDETYYNVGLLELTA